MNVEINDIASYIFMCLQVSLKKGRKTQEGQRNPQIENKLTTPREFIKLKCNSYLKC